MLTAVCNNCVAWCFPEFSSKIQSQVLYLESSVINRRSCCKPQDVMNNAFRTTMKKKLITEILYFFSSIIISFIVFHFTFSLTNLQTESVLDINIHDTYFVIQKIEFLPLFTLICLYVIYLIRVIIQRFKSRSTLWIYSIISLLLIIFFPNILSFVLSLSVGPGWTVNPPLSALEPQVEPKENVFDTIFSILYSSYIIIIFLGAFGIFKLGKLYNGTVHNSSL